MSEPPDSLDEAMVKAALEQVQKRLEAQVALKTSTETRALTLAGHCVTALVAITAAALVEAIGGARWSLLAPALAGGGMLLLALGAAYAAVRPRDLTLPGCLPDELWDDVTAPAMGAAEFMARYIRSLQDPMAVNERQQRARADALAWALRLALGAVPMAVLAAIVAHLLR